MHPVAEQLQRAFNLLADYSGDVESSAPAQDQLSPWALWLLLGLVRQVDRQRWVSTVAMTKLGIDMDEMSSAGALAHPAIPQKGLLPDFPAWEYYLHGRGCCLTNRITGESIDVDFYDGMSDWIDDFFYIGFLKSLKNPEPIEKRLIELFPSIETVILEFEELLELGILQKHPDSKVVTPLEEFLALSDGIDKLSTALQSDESRFRAGRALGDWMLASRSISDSADDQTRAHECISVHQKHLMGLFNSGVSERLALIALCDLVPDSSDILARALKKPPSGTTSAALEIVTARADEDWTEPVYDLLRRTNPSGDLPHPYTWTTCAEYLLQRQCHIDDIRKAFMKIGRRSLGDAAVLALEYLPEFARDLFHRALRSDVPLDRNTAAAALAIIDQPWSHKILQSVLTESTDQEATAECRSALMALPHRHLHESVMEWERINPHEPETGQFISMGEMSLRNRDTWIQQEMEKLHDRVIRLRRVIPPEQ